jgi:hypothetical protein
LIANDKSRSRSTGRMPDFIAIGPPRTGTTWLHGVLYHRTWLPRAVKETHFFDRYYDKGLQWYLDCFRAHADGRLVGEITPAYFASPVVRDRAARCLPQCKIICTLRDPVARAYSHYRKLHTVGMTRGGFADEVMNNGEIREASRYAFHLRAWRELFGERNVRAFLYDDLEAHAQGYADAICRFIGVAPLELTPEVNRSLDRNEVRRGARNRVIARRARDFMYWLQSLQAHRTIETLGRARLWQLCAYSGEEFAPLTPALEAQTRQHFLPEVEALEELLERDLSAWKPAGQAARLAADSG